MTSTVLENIAELTTNDPTLGDYSVMGRLFDAAIVVDEQRVLWVGANADAPDADERVDVKGAAIVPGFVDSHTHLVFAGERCDEFEARLRGERYDGGGIGRTVESTRHASRHDLRHVTAKRAHELHAGGVTTLEIKSGYELTVAGEERLLEVAAEFSDDVTFLGAHGLPEEFRDDRDRYVELVAGEMLARCAPLAHWADVFCDVGAFDVDEARTILVAAREAGLGLRLHANQLDDIGAVGLGVELDVASVDHCTHVSDGDVAALASSRTVVTLLPGAEFCTGSPYPSARRFLDAGATVALATDCNPGTSYVTSMPLVIALAVREMTMSPDEALWAATLGGARALRRDDVGRLGVGARADLVILDAPRSAHLAYRPGGALVARVMRAER
ncbi:MAG: imidazolonepropionase [Acidimicrobiales bacterium]|jgi:imidazolonepropionase